MNAEDDFSKRQEQAVSLHNGGDFEAALTLYMQLLAQKPSDPVMWSRMAVLMSQQDSMEKAFGFYERSLALDPVQPQARCNLAKAYLSMGEEDLCGRNLIKAYCLNPGEFVVLWSLALFGLDIRKNAFGLIHLKRSTHLSPERVEARILLAERLVAANDFSEAIGHLKAALKSDLHNPRTLYLLGNSFFSSGDAASANQAFKRALCLEPGWPEALGNLGLSLDQTGEAPEALRILQRAARLSPSSHAILNNLGSVAFGRGDLDLALRAFSGAIHHQPAFVDAWLNRARGHYQKKAFREAIEDAKTTLALQPESSPALEIAGLGSNCLRQWQAAIRFFKQAIAAAPRSALLRFRFGGALELMRFNDDAVRLFQSSLCLDPALPEALVGLSGTLWRLKSLETAISLQSRAVSLARALPFNEGELLHRRMHISDWRDFEVSLGHLRNHVRAGQSSIEPFSYLALQDDPALHLSCANTYMAYLSLPTNPTPQRAKAPSSKIRLGYFSSDFRDHPVAHLVVQLLERHNRDRFEVYAFSFGGSVEDPWRERVINAVDHFKEVTLLSDEAIVDMSCTLGIDIAIDLNGHTQGSRPGIFSLRAAPVQVHYIGYLGTLGAHWMDYLIADPCVIPEDERSHYREKIISLPLFQANEDYQPITSDGTNRDVEGLPSSAFIYCCFNTNYKLTPAVFSAWMDILIAVPNSVLWLYASNPLVQENLEKEAFRQGVDPARLVFAKRRPLDEHLKRLSLADLFLDTHPYNAGATASNSLRAGVPVLTFMGRSFVSRMSGSLMRAAGLGDLVAENMDDYVKKAIDMGHNPSQLASYKTLLRSRLSEAALFDTRAFARYLEMAFESIHARHLDGLPPEHLLIES